jgi:hypothetical protein
MKFTFAETPNPPKKGLTPTAIFFIVVLVVGVFVTTYYLV